MQALETHLKTWPALREIGARVCLGEQGEVPADHVETIEIVRAPEQADDLVEPRRGTVRLDLTLFARGLDDATDDTREGYRKLAALEDAVTAALQDFQKNHARVESTDYDLNMLARIPDGGIWRPTVASLTRLAIEWRKVT